MHQRKTGGKVIHGETAVELSRMSECPIAALTQCHAAGREQPGEPLMAHRAHSRDGSLGEEKIFFITPLHHLFSNSLPMEFVLTLPMQDSYSSKARSKIRPAHTAGLIHLLQ